MKKLGVRTPQSWLSVPKVLYGVSLISPSDQAFMTFLLALISHIIRWFRFMPPTPEEFNGSVEFSCERERQGTPGP